MQGSSKYHPALKKKGKKGMYSQFTLTENHSAAVRGKVNVVGDPAGAFNTTQDVVGNIPLCRRT